MSLSADILRSDLEEQREVNHHGHPVKVGADGTFLTSNDKYEQYSTPYIYWFKLVLLDMIKINKLYRIGEPSK